MRLINLTSGLPFKAAWRAALLFLLLSIAAGAVLIDAVENTLIDELQAQVDVETALFTEIYRERGRSGLLEALQVISATPEVPKNLSGLLAGNGLSLIGPVSRLPEFVGTKRHEVTYMTAGKMSGVYVLSVRKLDESTLVVGHSDRNVLLAKKRLTIWMLSFIAWITLMILAIGLWASRASLHRLDRMETALRQVGDGDLSARLPLYKDNDQFDRVSHRVNQNLDHLEHAVSGMKATVTALAHDLKTPLSHVQIALYAAADNAEGGGDPLPKIEAALRETENLNGIFESIMRITRIRAKSDKNHFACVSLQKLAEKSFEFLKPLSEANEQVLCLEIDRCLGAEDNLPVPGDEGMLLQAIINLVKNAVVHAGQGATITIAVSKSAIEVRDNGTGVDEKDLDRLVHFFARGDAARGTEGSGLGLALVKAVADHHNAELLLKNLHPGFLVRLAFMPKNPV